MSSRPFSLSTESGSATSGRAPQRRRRADSDDEHAGDHCGQASEQVHPLRARHAERLDTCHEGSRPILGGRPSQYPGQLLCRAETRGSARNRLRSRGSGNGGVVAGQHATGRGGLLPVRPWPFLRAFVGGLALAGGAVEPHPLRVLRTRRRDPRRGLTVGPATSLSSWPGS